MLVAVATNHRGGGGRRVRTTSISPANTGPLPSAMTVPRATPVRSVPARKLGW